MLSLFATALCPTASYGADRVVDDGRLEQARAYEREGRHASAWATFLRVADEAALRGDATTQRVARESAAALEGTLLRLAIEVPNAPADLTITRNGVIVARAHWGQPLPVDPGKLTLEATMPGRTPWSTTIEMSKDHPNATLRVPELPVAPLVVARPSATPASPLRTAAVLTLAAGAATMGASAYFAFVADTKETHADARCHGETLCDAQGRAMHTSAAEWRNVATGTLAIGGGLLVGGALLFGLPYLRTGRLDSPRLGKLRVDPGLGQLQVNATF